MVWTAANSDVNKTLLPFSGRNCPRISLLCWMAKKVACATLLRWQSLFYPNVSEALICRKKGESTSSTHPFSHKKALYDDDLEKINTLFICCCQQASRMKMRGSRCGREKCHAKTCICKKNFAFALQKYNCMWRAFGLSHARTELLETTKRRVRFWCALGRKTHMY